MELDELIQELDKKLIVTKKPRRLEKWIKEAKKSM